MKKITFFAMLFLLSTALAAQGQTRMIPHLGVDGKFAGCFCCVKQTCVVAKNEVDCKKIGGVKIKKCEECEKAAEKKK